MTIKLLAISLTRFPVNLPDIGEYLYDYTAFSRLDRLTHLYN